MKKVLLNLLLAFVSLYSQSKPDQINISRSPVSLFKDYCSRCHGYEGIAYGKGFGEMVDADLKKVIKEMMVGPAQLKPDDIEIEAMYSYNKALRDNKPFAIVLNSKSFQEGKDKSLLISVSPKTVINIENYNQVEIEKSQDMYNLFYNPAKIKKIKIIVTKNKTSSSFYFPEELLSD